MESDLFNPYLGHFYMLS